MADRPGDDVLGAFEDPLASLEGAGQHAREVSADRRLLRDDEGLAHEPVEGSGPVNRHMRRSDTGTARARAAASAPATTAFGTP